MHENNTLVGKPKGIREDNIKMDIRETGCECWNSMERIQDSL
jgi:hypothetical protein